MVPGLCDSHIHVCMTGESSYFLDLKDKESEDFIAQFNKYVLGVEPHLPFVVRVRAWRACVCAAHDGTCVYARACVAMHEFVARHRVLTRGIALLSVQVLCAQIEATHGIPLRTDGTPRVRA